ncbi:MAG: universal stress protein [Solirubrobacteraceae bacterium]
MAADLAGPDGHLTLLAVTAVSGSGQYATAAISPSRVVMGSRRLRGLRALGSVSRHAAHDAPCSVPLLPPE